MALVRIKLAAYQFQKYGMLEGIVKTISADAQSASQEKGDLQGTSRPLAFKALIELQQQRLAVDDQNLALAAGMQVSAEIVQGERTAGVPAVAGAKSR